MGNLLLNGALVYPTTFRKNLSLVLTSRRLGILRIMESIQSLWWFDVQPSLLLQAIAIRLCQPCQYSLFFPQVPWKIGALVILVLFPDLTGLEPERVIRTSSTPLNKAQMDEYHESHTSSTGTLNTLYSSLCVTKDTFPIEQI